MGFEAKHEFQLEKMHGCGCFKNLIPNLLMFNGFQI